MAAGAASHGPGHRDSRARRATVGAAPGAPQGQTPRPVRHPATVRIPPDSADRRSAAPLARLSTCTPRAKVDLARPNFPVTTIAGAAGSCGFADGSPTAARFSQPRGIAIMGDGSIYVADTGNHVTRAITPSQVSTMCGLAGQPGSTDGTGSAARFNSPIAITYSPMLGRFFVSDQGNFTVREVDVGGVVSTVAGAAGLSGTTDGTGAAARFRGPDTLVAGSYSLAGDLFVADGDNTGGDGVTWRYGQVGPTA
jgi:hypothetical protein